MATVESESTEMRYETDGSEQTSVISIWNILYRVDAVSFCSRECASWWCFLYRVCVYNGEELGRVHFSPIIASMVDLMTSIPD